MNGPGLKKCTHCHRIGCAGHTGAIAMQGITRRVMQEFPRTPGDRRYRYLLECGHIVHRNVRGKQFCYWAACLMAGDP